jgi:hypothetical protein
VVALDMVVVQLIVLLILILTEMDGMSRGVSRCLDQWRRLKIFNFFRPSAVAVKKLSGNRRRLKFFDNFFKKFLVFEKSWGEKGKIDNRERSQKKLD